MVCVFADTSYYIALLNPRDPLNGVAKLVSSRLSVARIVTTEMVLAELLNGLGGMGTLLRRVAVRAVDEIEQDPNTMLIPQSRKQFRSGFKMYRKREDKTWSLTDCVSFIVMHQHEITEALTDDHHFQQAGFRALLREEPPGDVGAP